MKIIKSFDQLDQWLEENDYFEEGYVLKVEKSPLAITVGYLISGNYEAHTEKQILSFTITPSKIREWNNPENFVPSEDHIIERIEALEFDHGKGGIGLQFLVPPLFTLVAESFTISDPEIIKTFFKPWLSDCEIYARAPMAEVPRPSFWKQKFYELGYEIVFRYYAGDAKQPQELPYPNYSGYFIQLADKIKETERGIFIYFLSMENHRVTLCFSKKDENLDNLWIDLTAILADIPEVKMNCGNCHFTGAEWKQLLKDKRYPPKMEPVSSYE